MLVFIALLNAVIITLLIFMRPKFGIYLLIFFSIFHIAFFNRLKETGISRFWTWLPFLFAGILLFALLMKYAIEHKFLFYKKSPIQYLYLFSIGMFCIALFSCILNNVSPLMGIFGLRYFLLLALFASFLYSYKVLNLNIISFMRFVVYLGILQVPFSILQRVLFLNSGKISISSLDLVTGTFAYYFSLAFIQLLSVSIVIIYWLSTGRSIIGKSSFLLIGILFVPLILSNSRAVFLYLIILMFIITIRYRKELMKKFFHYIIYGAILIAIMYTGFVYVFWRFQRNDYRDLKKQYSIDYILEYTYRGPVTSYQYLKWGDDPSMGRLKAIITSFNLIADSPLTLLFGLGSGNIQDSQVLGIDGKYYQKFGRLAGLSKNQLSLILSEFGFLGLFLHLLFFWGLWKVIQGVKNINMLEFQLTSGVFLILSTLLFLFFTYSQILNSYVVILVLSYFIALLQKKYLQLGD